MKVLIIGGYGVFGRRLATLLVRDGHKVCIAGRNNEAAMSLASEIGCDAIRLDRDGPLSGLEGFDAIVDAAGPFHTYGTERYRVARAAIGVKAHYFDLCDDADFCSGISELDEEARQAGVCAISGLSSTPALSSTVVGELLQGDHARAIETAILPGNRSARGMSVMHSILNQSGRAMKIWQGGAWDTAHGWSDPADYTLPKRVRRQGWRIQVPDAVLFPDHFKADTVIFRAGLELGIMRYGLAAFAALRRVVPIPINRSVVRVFKTLADGLGRFGTGIGGMSVSVTAGRTRRTWALLAENGAGPFVPAVATRALLRRQSLPLGAMPALNIIRLAEAEKAMEDLDIITERREHVLIPEFEKALGHQFDELPSTIKDTHMTASCSRWSGQSSVERGSSVLSHVIGALFGFPAASENVGVEVTKTVTSGGETWVRTFDRRRFRSRLKATASGMTETFAPFTFLLDLNFDGTALRFPVRSCKLGPLPVPKWLLPRSEAREYVEDGKFQFDVAIYAPLTDKLVVRYRGWLEAAPRHDP